MISVLLWKDFHVIRTIILGNVIANFAIYLIVTVALASSVHPVTRPDWLDAYVGSAIAGVFLTCALASAHGGTAFAQERSERSANFLAMLPVQRGPIILSKLIVTVLCSFGMILINLIILLICLLLQSNSWNFHTNIGSIPDNLIDLRKAVSLVGAITLMLFGVGWFLSTMLQSASVSTLSSIGATFAINLLIVLIINRAELAHDAEADAQMLFCGVTSFLIGMSSFLAATIYYLKRVEP